MSVSVHPHPVIDGAARGGYLAFEVGAEQYAIDILSVQEIRRICPLTPLPHAPDFVRGVMNLRGAIVPVVDLCRMLGLEAVSIHPLSVIVVVNVRGRTTGFVVDAVSDVLSLDSSVIERTPELGQRADATIALGIARVGERLVVLLDLERIASELGPKGARA